VLTQKRQLLASGRARASKTVERAPRRERRGSDRGCRAAYVEALAAALAAVRERTRLSLPPLRVEYLPSPRAAAAAATRSSPPLARIASRERDRGAPLLGPHRDALRLLGTAATSAPSLRRGSARPSGCSWPRRREPSVETTGKAPLYLLDDADAELDRERLAGVWQAFGPVAQLLATSSRPEVWEGLETAHRWRVAEGRVYAP
jgi:recombinational DNA repair ATPase RecF